MKVKVKSKNSKNKFILVGNWKMNPDTVEEAKKLVSIYERKAKKTPRVSVIICPPLPFISSLAGKGSRACHFGAQDIDFRSNGSYTGAVSARQVQSVGAEYAIVGHSERRAAGDTAEQVTEKVKLALEAGLRVILCVGELVRDNQAHYLRAIREQVLSVISAVDRNKVRFITIAYEPVWAIGKSYANALAPTDIHEMSIYIKKVVAEALGKDAGLRTQVLYGGSVNFENAQAILSDGEIDGLLIGRQSLDAEAFSNIIDYANGI